MNKKPAVLKPVHILDDGWNVSGAIPEESHFGVLGYHSRADTLEQYIRSTRIEIAPFARTEAVGSDETYDYLKTELGMNMIVPRGRVKELRFKMSLSPAREVVAMDGFPNDRIEERHIVDGKIRIALNTAFKFIPGVGPVLSELLKIDLNPWNFSIGSMRKVVVDFSGGLTGRPEWYFRKEGIKGNVNLIITLRKSKSVRYIKGETRAAWYYDPGIFKAVRLGTDTESIHIL